MEKKKPNRSVLRTQHMLKQGLIELMKEKPVKEITVKELVEHVNLNRGTFYLHYKDIFDLLKQTEDELLNEFRAIVSSTPVQNLDNQPLPILKDIFVFVQTNADFARMVLGRNRDPHLITELTDILKEKCFHDWKYLLNDSDPQVLETFYAYCIPGSIGVIEKWLFDGMKETPEEIAMITSNYILHGFRGICAAVPNSESRPSHTP